MGESYSFGKRMLFSFSVVLLLARHLLPWYYYRICAVEALKETQTMTTGFSTLKKASPGREAPVERIASPAEY
jgi:hypothetical protein